MKEKYPINLDDITPFDPPGHIPCPQCGGDLVATSLNSMNTLVFVDCKGDCKLCFQLPVGKEYRDILSNPPRLSKEAVDKLYEEPENNSHFPAKIWDEGDHQ